MPELTDVSPSPTPTVTETVTEVLPPPVVDPLPTESVAPATAVLDPATGDQLRDVLDSVNSMNAVLEGQSVTETTGPLELHADQFGALALGLALVVALLAALLVVSLRR